MTLFLASGTDQAAPRYMPIASGFVTVFFASVKLLGAPVLLGWLFDTTDCFHNASSYAVIGLVAGVGLSLQIRRYPLLSNPIELSRRR